MSQPFSDESDLVILNHIAKKNVPAGAKVNPDTAKLIVSGYKSFFPELYAPDGTRESVKYRKRTDQQVFGNLQWCPYEYVEEAKIGDTTNPRLLSDYSTDQLQAYLNMYTPMPYSYQPHANGDVDPITYEVQANGLKQTFRHAIFQGAPDALLKLLGTHGKLFDRRA